MKFGREYINGEGIPVLSPDFVRSEQERTLSKTVIDEFNAYDPDIKIFWNGDNWMLLKKHRAGGYAIIQNLIDEKGNAIDIEKERSKIIENLVFLDPRIYKLDEIWRRYKDYKKNERQKFLSKSIDKLDGDISYHSDKILGTKHFGINGLLQ